MQDKNAEKATTQETSRRDLLKKLGKTGYVAPMTLMLLTGKAAAVS